MCRDLLIDVLQSEMGAKEKDKMCHYDTWGLGGPMCLLNYQLLEISTDYIREKGFENERN